MRVGSEMIARIYTSVDGFCDLDHQSTPGAVGLFPSQNTYLIRGGTVEHIRKRVSGTFLRCAGRSCWIRCRLRTEHRVNGARKMTTGQITHRRKGVIWTATLNPLLEPRLSPGQPGRRRGVSNYEWTPETDRLLVELCTKWGAAKAKHIIGRRLQEGLLSDAAPKPDSVRKSVEYRMAKLGISTGRKRRKPDGRSPKRWTESQTNALLGALGADATIESIAGPHAPTP